MFISIRHKLALLLFVSMFVLSLLIAGLLQYHSYVKLEESERNTSEAAIRAAILITDRWIASKLELINELSHHIEKTVFQENEILPVLKSFADANKLKTGAYAGLDSRGYLDSSGWIPPDDYVYQQRPWYKIGKEVNAPAFVPPYQDAMTGEVAITFAAPIFCGETHTFDGIVAFDVFLKELRKKIGDIFEAKVNKIVSLYLPNERFAMILQTSSITEEQTHLLMNHLAKNGLADNTTYRLAGERFAVIYDGVCSDSETHYDATGKKDDCAQETVVIYPLSLTELLTPIVAQSLMYIGLMGMGLLSVLVFTWWLLGHHIKRIEDLNDIAGKISTGNFDVRAEKDSEDEIGQLAEAFNKMVMNLKTHIEKVKETVREKESIEKELNIAAEIQEKALPKNMPEIEGLEIAAKSFPAKAVGGDYYDFVRLDEKKTGFIIADAVGKGMPASLYMSNARSAFRVISGMESSPAETIKKVNAHMSNDEAQPEGMFITYVFGVYNEETKKITYSNAGHFPPIVFNNTSKEFRSMDAGGAAIGIVEDIVYAEETIDFGDGDILVMYTDGVTEAFDAGGDMYGFDRMVEVVKNNSDKSAEKIIDSIYDSVNNFAENVPQHDDLTIVVVKKL